jgi:hypothetical protein
MQKAAKLVATATMLASILSMPHTAAFARQEGAAASCSAPADLSSLSGVWSDKNAIKATKQGALRTQHFYRLEFNQDGTVKGLKIWRNYKSDGFPGFDVSGRKVYEDSESVVGIFEQSDCSLALVETTSEAGIFKGTLLDDGRIRVAFVQAGEADPLVVRGLLSKESATTNN